MNDIKLQDQEFDDKKTHANQHENDWKQLIPLVAENTKEGKKEPAILEVNTEDYTAQKNEWLSDFLKSIMTSKMKLFIDDESIRLPNTNQPTIQWNSQSFTQLISGWALQLFNNHYRQNEMSSPVCYAGSRELREEFLIDVPPANIILKQDIFHYVYAVLYYSSYYEKYEADLQYSFPRIPFYNNFYKWESWGKRLMDLHINYESVAPFGFARKEIADKKEPTTKLCALKEEGIIQVDENTELHNIPKEAWQYEIGSQSALEWILNQCKEKKWSNPIIGEKFNSYRFADYKEEVIALLQKVCTVSMETIKIIGEMDKVQN